jgi:hypothetical protein
LRDEDAFEKVADAIWETAWSVRCLVPVTSSRCAVIAEHIGFTLSQHRLKRRKEWTFREQCDGPGDGFLRDEVAEGTIVGDSYVVRSARKQRRESRAVAHTFGLKAPEAVQGKPSARLRNPNEIWIFRGYKGGYRSHSKASSLLFSTHVTAYGCQ